MSAPTGDTDPLADWFLPTVPEPHAVNEDEDGPGGWDEMALRRRRRVASERADALRAAAAEDRKYWVAPPEVAAVFDAAGEFHRDGRRPVRCPPGDRRGAAAPEGRRVMGKKDERIAGLTRARQAYRGAAVLMMRERDEARAEVARLTANVEELENGVDAGVAIIERLTAEVERLRGEAAAEPAPRRMATPLGTEHDEDLHCTTFGCVPVDDARLTCARCGLPIYAEPHTDADGSDVLGDCCRACHPERGA